MALKDVTVYIGRFSPFHKGHAFVLEQALKTSKLVIVLIGSSGSARTIKNPFTFEERRAMVENWAVGIQGAGSLQVRPLRDYPYNDARWIQEVQDTVRRTMKDHWYPANTVPTDVYITGSDRDESTWYLKAFPQWKQTLQAPYRENGVLNVSATEIREWMFDASASDNPLVPAALPPTTMAIMQLFMLTDAHEQLKHEYDIIKSYKRAWSMAPYPPTFNTADAVVIQSGHVLVVERGAYPGKGLWALPGGFVNQNERVRDAAVRELMEETGILLAEGKKAKELTKTILEGSIKAQELFDKPDRSLRGRTITMAYLFRLDDTKPLPKVSGQNAPLEETGGKIEVETARAFWVPINQALNQSRRWFEDHHSIVEWAVSNQYSR